MYGKKIGVIFLSLACLFFLSSGAATARPINPLDYFAPGKIGATLETVSAKWDYRYIAGDKSGDTFTVELTGWVDELGEHRNYSKKYSTLNKNTNQFEEVEEPYLFCDIGRRSMTIIEALEGEIFDFWALEELTPSILKTDTVIPVDNVTAGYAWYLTLHRGTYLAWTTSWLRVAVLDRSAPLGPVAYTHGLVGLDPDNPDHQGLVVCFADFLKDIGLIRFNRFDYTDYEPGDPESDIKSDCYELKSVTFSP
ncbi:MAG: hypothetical protein QME75_12570 [Deltaproteobacteria bacterium]|nr:hypothetical protein [Deltaproteobacteria bacterium]